MVDMHSHILPNIDDGAKSLEETYALIQEAKNAGFNGIVLTSHYIEGYYESDVGKRTKLIETIYEEINDANLKLYIANEIYLSERIIELLKQQKASSINNTKYILFEMPMNSKPMNLYEVVYELLQHKLIPILAHPERYTFIQENSELIYDLIQKGVLMQANYGSIIGQYGKKAQIMVTKFLQSDMIHFLGTDVHRPNTVYPKIPQIMDTLNKLIGKEEIEKLTITNPTLVLDNEKIDINEPRELKFTLREKMIMKSKK